MKTVLTYIAILANIFILTACGGGGGGSAAPTETLRAQNRVITCENCQPAQLQALGGAARTAQAGDNITLTLSLTDSQYAEITAWLNSGGNLPPPDAICREGIYETHTNYHGGFNDVYKWAIVRNGATLEVDGRQQHGRHLADTAALAAADTALSVAVSIRDAAEENVRTIALMRVCSSWIAAGKTLETCPYTPGVSTSHEIFLRTTYQRNFNNAVKAHTDVYAEHHARHNDLQNSYRPGDIIRVLEQGDNGELPAGDYRVITLTTGNILLFAMPITLTTGARANNCNAAPTAQQYYVLESGDNAWKAGGNFAFNMRGIMAGAAAIQTKNFLFAHANDLRDLHMEFRADPITLHGLGIYADTGFKWENNGETQAHYGKIMGVYPLLPDDSAFSPALDLYASTGAGKVHSEYYEDSRLHGFAAGFFARRILRHNDEWHVRFRQPLAAREIAAWQFSANAQIGAPENMLSLGYYRELHGKSGATLIWRRQF